MGAWERLSRLWREEPQGMALDLLRVGMGAIWAVNLVFVIDPQNAFFQGFRASALSYAPTSVGGPAVADFIGAHSALFAWLFAVTTAYLAVALLAGLTTRLACLVGGGFSVGLLLTQVGSTFFVPGGTDVGPHPLYLVAYLTLFLGGAGRYVAVDAWLWRTGRARLPRLARWVASPPR